MGCGCSKTKRKQAEAAAAEQQQLEEARRQLAEKVEAKQSKQPVLVTAAK